MAHLKRTIGLLICSLCSISAADALPPTRHAQLNWLEWIETTASEALGDPWDAGQYLPDDSDATLRLQFWSDRLYEALLSRYPEHLQHDDRVVPRPRIHLRRDLGANAYAASTTVCYRLPIRFAGRDQPSDVSSVVMIHPRGTVGIYGQDRISCVQGGRLPIDPHLLRRFLVETVQVQGCQIGVDAESLVLGENCRLPPEVIAGGAGGLALKVATNHLSIDLGVLTALADEGQVVSVLLHELAHYYRAHGSLNKAAYRFFYRLRDPITDRPTPAPELEDLGRQLVAMGKFRTQPIASQRWHSEMFSYGRLIATRLVDPSCRNADQSCFKACRTWREMIADEPQMSRFGRFPQGILDETGLQQYASWEDALDQCLATIAIVDLNPEPGQAMLSDVRSVFWAAPYESERYPTVLEAGRAMSESLLERDRQRNGLLARALELGVGLYTTEEEADNLALQWLPLLGWPAHSAIDQWWSYAMLRKGSEQETEYNWSVERCRAAASSAPPWTHDGEPQLVPVGSYGEDHHSSCFRVFNLDRRRAAQPIPLNEELRRAAQRYGGPFEQLISNPMRKKPHVRFDQTF